MKQIALKAGEELILIALTLWYCAADSATPSRVRFLILGDLAYLVNPLDVVPDALPIVGFSDDFALLSGTIALIASHVRPTHRRSAEATLSEWFGVRPA